MAKPFVGLAVAVVVGAAAVFVMNHIYIGDADVIHYNTFSTERISCSDPKHLNHAGCAQRACSIALFDEGGIPDTHEEHAKEFTGFTLPDGYEYKGTVDARKGPAAFPPKTFTCIVQNGRVSSLMVDGMQRIAKVK